MRAYILFKDSQNDCTIIYYPYMCNFKSNHIPLVLKQWQNQMKIEQETSIISLDLTVRI